METYQAGLSWETVLNKRQAFRKAFHGYQIQAVADMTDTELEALLDNPAIIRNRAKILLHALTPKLSYGYRQNMALLMPIFGPLLRGKRSLTMFPITAKPQLKPPLSEKLAKRSQKTRLQVHRPSRRLVFSTGCRAS